MNRYLGKVSLAAAGMAIVVLCAQLAEAQGGGGGGQGGGRGRRGGGFGTNAVTLASNAEVQTLLKLTDAQKTKITEINNKLRADRQELQSGGGGPEMFAEMQKMNADAEAKVAEALDATQNTNLLSILVQASGGPALNNSLVAKHLKLTDAQKTQVGELAAPGRGGGGFRRGGGGGGGGEPPTPEQLAAQRAERDKPFIDLLTADQKTEWGKLEKAQAVGDELLQQLRQGGRGRRGGRGGGGGGGGGGGI
jgi:hypothetical protein